MNTISLNQKSIQQLLRILLILIALIASTRLFGFSEKDRKLINEVTLNNYSEMSIPDSADPYSRSAVIQAIKLLTHRFIQDESSLDKVSRTIGRLAIRNLCNIYARKYDNRSVHELLNYVNAALCLSTTSKFKIDKNLYVVVSRSPKILKSFISNSAFYINDFSSLGYTLLGLAIHAEDTGNVKILLEAGANPHALMNIDGELITPLELAVRGYNLGIIRLLLDYGADHYFTTCMENDFYHENILDLAMFRLHGFSIKSIIGLVRMLTQYAINVGDLNLFHRILRVCQKLEITEAMLDTALSAIEPHTTPHLEVICAILLEEAIELRNLEMLEHMLRLNNSSDILTAYKRLITQLSVSGHSSSAQKIIDLFLKYAIDKGRSKIFISMLLVTDSAYLDSTLNYLLTESKNKNTSEFGEIIKIFLSYTMKSKNPSLLERLLHIMTKNDVSVLIMTRASQLEDFKDERGTVLEDPDGMLSVLVRYIARQGDIRLLSELVARYELSAEDLRFLYESPFAEDFIDVLDFYDSAILVFDHEKKEKKKKKKQFLIKLLKPRFMGYFFTS